MSDVKEQIKKDYLSGVMPKALAEKYDISLNTVKFWIKRNGWSKLKNEGAPSDVTQSAPPRKHGLFSRYLSEDTLEIFATLDDSDPLDLLWDQIKFAYTAILRAQQIMHVEDKEDKTIERIEEKSGEIYDERWEDRG